jgi:hypothetical protein
MSGNNPYAKFLDGRAPEQILAATGAELAALLTVMGPKKAATAPAPGKWSPAEIVSHLADCEIAFGFRLRQILAEESPILQPFDQDKWAAEYGAIPAEEALAAFLALREWNLRVIRRGLAEGAERTANHPERGKLTFRSMVELIAGHDLNHLTQMRHLAGELRA